MLNLYVVTQPQDAVLQAGATLNIPYRFLEPFAAGLARRLARKYAPQLVQELMVEEKMAWDESAQEDSEDCAWHITPGLGGYFS